MRYVAVAAFVLAAACGGAGAGGAGGASRSAQTTRPDPDMISLEEVATVRAPTVYDVVRQLRPQWMMRTRRTTVMTQNQGQLVTYLDGTRYGNMESLRQLSPRSVASIRYFSPSNAEARFGPGHLLGAIEVKTLPQ